MKKLFSAIIYIISISSFLLLIVSAIFFIICLVINAEPNFLSAIVFVVSSLTFWISGVLLNTLSNQPLQLGARQPGRGLQDRLSE